MSEQLYTREEAIKLFQEELRQGWVRGTECMCCKQGVKLNRHSINSAISRLLIDIYESDDEWVNIFRDMKTYTTMYSIAAFWNLIEPRGDEPQNGSKTSGYWRLTDKGRAFVERETTIPKWAYIYNNQLKGFAGEQVDIVQTLGRKFNYDELMHYTD